MPFLPPFLRACHRHAGLFLSPFVLLFAASTIIMNHPPAVVSAGPVVRREVAVQPPPGEPGSIPHARALLAQLGVTGEIDHVRHEAKAARLVIPVTKPGQSTRIEVDLREGRATVRTEERGLGEALTYLHRMPGPHNARFRGNWVYLGWWAVTVDVVVAGILLVSVSGLHLWWRLRGERAAGWVLAAGGAATVAVLAGALVLA